MAFELPDYSSLTPQQVDIINLPTNKNFLISGSPGTGKTVIAIYRAAQMRNKKVLLLVYYRPLMLYLKSAIDELRLSDCTVNTCYSWGIAFYKAKFGVSAPKITEYELDWEQILADCKNMKPTYDHVIIDEAQDFPVELLELLRKVATHVTCFIDPNQAIEPNKVDVITALKKFCIEAPFTLEFNYRNTKEIADVAKLYWHKEGLFAKARRKGNRLPSMIKCVGYEEQDQQMIDIIRDHKDATIGVIVNNQSLNITYDILSKELKGEVRVEMYKTMGAKSAINFNTNGVKILSYRTMKGLEFDIVILPRFEKINSTGDEMANQNRAYVAISRARDDLYICYFSQTISPGWIDTMSPIMANRHLFQWR